MSANKIKKEIEKKRKEGIKEPKPQKAIPFNVLQEQFKVITQRRNDLMKERQELSKQFQENDKKLFECQSQMQLLTQLMNPKKVDKK